VPRLLLFNNFSNRNYHWHFRWHIFSSSLWINNYTATGEINPSTSTAGSYTIHYQIASGGNGCTAVNATYAVMILASPLATVNGQNNPTCYGSATGTIIIAASGGSGGGFSFSVDNGVTWAGPFASPYTYPNLVANQAYQVRVKDSNGCTSRQVQ